MGILTAIGSALGLAADPRTVGHGPAIRPGSPWADSSHLAQFTDAALHGYVGGITMDRSRAMQLSVIAAARRRIAATIGRLPLVTITSSDGTPTSSPADRLLTQPEPGRTRVSTLTWTVDTLMFYPTAHWLVTDRDAAGWPVSVRLVAKQDETLDDQGQLVAVGGRPVHWRDVIRFESPASGLLIDAADALRRGWLLAQAAARAEANPVPALDLHNEGEDLSNEEIEQLLTSWEAARARRGVAYSSRSLKVSALGAPTENLLIAGRRQIDIELCRHAGIPSWAADAPVDGSSLNYTNRQSRNQELIDDALAPFMAAVTSRLSLPDITPRGKQVEFDTDNLTKPTRAERFAMLQDAVAADLMTRDEARAEENLPATNQDQETPNG